MKQTFTKFLPRTRCTEEELEAVKMKAQKAGLSVSEFQRRACNYSVVIVRESAIEKKFVNQLLAIGNNLNQLTHKAHIHEEYDRKDLRNILDRLDSVLTNFL